MGIEGVCRVCCLSLTCVLSSVLFLFYGISPVPKARDLQKWARFVCIVGKFFLPCGSGKGLHFVEYNLPCVTGFYLGKKVFTLWERFLPRGKGFYLVGKALTLWERFLPFGK